MRYSLIFLSLFIFSSSIMMAQTFQPKSLNDDSKGIVYDKEFSFVTKLHTNGPIVVGMTWGKIRTYYKSTYFHVEVGELKHPKEYRQNVSNLNGSISSISRSFIFGKQNNLYVLRAGYGVKRYYSEKAKKRGLAVGVTYHGGATLGFVKPYYLSIRDAENGAIASVEKYSPENEDRFLNVNAIFGSAGFTRGLGELRFTPGLHAQIAAHFDWGAFDEVIKALEVGIMADYFFQEPAILVEVENVQNKNLFLNVFINVQLGRRK